MPFSQSYFCVAQLYDVRVDTCSYFWFNQVIRRALKNCTQLDFSNKLS